MFGEGEKGTAMGDRFQVVKSVVTPQPSTLNTSSGICGTSHPSGDA